MGSIVVPVDDRLYSTLAIGSDAFPFALFHDDLSRFAQGFVNWHKQREIEISVILEGSVRVCLLREEHVLRAGESFLILPGALHAILPVAHEPGRYFTLIFDPRLLTGFPGSFFDRTWYAPAMRAGCSYQRLSGHPSSAAIHEHLFAIRDHADCADAQAQLAIQRRLQDVWLLLSAQGFTADSSGKAPEERRILAMIDYLRSHYSEKFSLREMADALHVSRGECCRYFRRMMGMTITEYLIDYRLSRAAQQLTGTGLTITEIAHSCGFNSPSSFSQAFREKTGQTPSQYRAENN